MIRLLGIGLLFTLISCNDVHINAAKSVTLPDPDSGSDPVDPPEALVWNFTSPTIRAGETVPFSFSNGGASFTTDAFGIGTFDPSTLIYSAPANLGPVSHTIEATDDADKTGSNTIKIAGFQSAGTVDFPLAFGDQNYVNSAVSLPNGSTFIGSIVIDGTGWERWLINRTDDFGLTWSEVDFYAPYDFGESHPMALANKANDIYVCGYAWDIDSVTYNSEWVVRKSSDNGVTWTMSDHFVQNIGENHVCYDIAVSSAGNIYTVGYTDTDGGVIRESLDEGLTWTTIGTIPSMDTFVSLDISPAGVLWGVSRDGHVWKGVYSLGSWNWTDSGSIMGVSPQSSAYQLFGDINVISETEAYYSGNGANWKIMKTTDSGATWSAAYTGAVRYKGNTIIKLTSGELVAIGSLGGALFSDPDTFKIIRSTDDGATWVETYSDVTVSKEGITLTEASDGSVLAFGVYERSPYQIINLRSTDSGATWSDRSEVYYKDNLYTTFNDLKVDGMGNIWATAWINHIDSTFRDPWTVIKSSDNGASWEQNELFVGPTSDAYAEGIAIGPANEVYVGGYIDSDDVIKKTTNSGLSWSVVDTNVGVSTYDKKMTVASDGTVYMSGVTGTSTILRKGTGSGTVWNTIQTFLNFSLLGIKTFDDNSLWIAAKETSPSTTYVIYRSIDGGTTLTEVYRVAESTWRSKTITKDSNGDILAHTKYKVIKTSDNGASWQDVYDGTALGFEILGFKFDSSDRLYILNTNGQVLAQNQFDGSWFVMFDYSLFNTYMDPELLQITDCGSASGVCLIGTYGRPGLGVQIEMIPLIMP